MAPVPEAMPGQQFCYLTTTGRTSGLSRTIEIWFAMAGRTLYMLAGGGRESDWVKNLLRQPEVRVRLGGADLAGRARIVQEAGEDRLARRLVFEKYQPTYGGDLTAWSRTSLPIAVDLD
jgi:deazaflavin-dependent oxidoreductase (nitroreductase family)